MGQGRKIFVRRFFEGEEFSYENSSDTGQAPCQGRICSQTQMVAIESAVAMSTVDAATRLPTP